MLEKFTSNIELPYFYIENSLGGNQDSLHNFMMRLGGCAAVTASDLCIYLALYQDMPHLYPFDVHNLTTKDYIRFTDIMKPYLHPRWTGIDRLDIYVKGFSNYLQNQNENTLKLIPIEGETPYLLAKAKIIQSLKDKIPLSYLLLEHKDNIFSDFTWHWFLVIGCQEKEGDDFLIKIVTYGEAHYLSFRKLWETGYPKKGGFILFTK